MKYRVAITPLNCSYDDELSNFVKFETSEYTATTDRAIYCKNPDLSWFKMKSSVASNPYLEPAFFGLSVGDTISVELDALAIYGNINKFCVSFRSIDSTGSVGDTAFTQMLPNGSITSHFKRFKIPFTVMPSISGGDGILLNIRNYDDNCEMVIKNIEIEIETTNNNFSLQNNVASLSYQSDYLNCINLYSGTDLNTKYNSLKTVYTNGQITFPDIETMSIKSINSDKNFKGLLSLLSASKYCQPQAVYIEYKNNDSSKRFSISSRDYDNAGLPINSEKTLYPPLSLGVWRKAIVYFSGKGRSGDKRNLILNVGSSSSEQDCDIKNVRFSAPRFDDAIKREPNKLEELYPSLGAKLRA